MTAHAVNYIMRCKIFTKDYLDVMRRRWKFYVHKTQRYAV